MMQKPILLLHACCATCLLYPFKLLKSSFEVRVFFYNPNIHPENEFQKRLKDIEKVCFLKDLPLIIGRYDDNRWFKLTSGLEKEPEGGKRCSLCFGMRLEETAKKAIELGISEFATTLTVSPHKNSRVINKIGSIVSKDTGLSFLEKDFKKKDGFKKTIDLSKKHCLYRQDYCGCIYSKRSL